MKIDQEKFKEFRDTLPEDIRNEYFHWLITAYDVPKALFLIKELNLVPHIISVEEWAKAYGLSHPQQNEDVDTRFQINLLNGVRDVDALKNKINPDIPIIIVEHEFGRGKKKETSTIIIDGNKRLRKAFLEGRKEIKAFFLPKKVAKLCIIS